MNFRKIYPLALVLIAVAGLYISYLTYKNSKHDCDCNKGGASQI
jgi:hypothetical protein